MTSGSSTPHPKNGHGLAGVTNQVQKERMAHLELHHQAMSPAHEEVEAGALLLAGQTPAAICGSLAVRVMIQLEIRAILMTFGSSFYAYPVKTHTHYRLGVSIFPSKAL